MLHARRTSRPRRKLVLGWAGGGLSLALAGSAHAEAARLVWSAPGTCPPESALRAEVARLLGESTLERGGFDAKAQVTADEPGRFTLVLSLHGAGGEGTRTLSAATCESLLKVAAFSIALAVNPDLAAAMTSNEPDADGDDAPTPPPIPPPPPLPPPAPHDPSSADSHTAPTSPTSSTPSPPPELWLGARVAGDTSLLPSPALGFGVATDVLLLGVLRVGVSGQVFIPQTELLSGGSGGHFTLWELEGRACYEASLGVRVTLCPLVQWGLLHGAGRGVKEELAQQSTFFAPGIAAFGRFPLSRRMSALVGVTGLFPLSRDGFTVAAGQVHEIPAFSLQGALGVEIRAF